MGEMTKEGGILFSFYVNGMYNKGISIIRFLILIMEVRKILRVGDSLGLTIPAQSGFNLGEFVAVTIGSGRIEIRKLSIEGEGELIKKKGKKRDGSRRNGKQAKQIQE